MSLARLASIAFVLALALLTAPGCGETPRSSIVERAELVTHATSSVLVAHERHDPGEAVVLALDILDEVRSGTPIAEVARRRSDDPGGAKRGGFLGFVRPRPMDALSAAIQALPPGTVGGPVADRMGFHVVYRHTYDEAQGLEAEQVVPIYGFLIRFAHDEDTQGELTKAEAKERAWEAWQQVRDGKLTLEEAAERYSRMTRHRPGVHLANAWPEGEHEAIRLPVLELEPGELAPMLEVPGAFAVVRRGSYFRALTFQILVQHARSAALDSAITRSEEEAEAIAEKVLAEVAPDASNWDELVRKHSDQVQSIPMSGFIGSITNGDLIPVLEEAIAEIEPGRVASRVVASPDGYHIFWRAK